ncbi:hypothetical protein FSP39_011664 [Pinctada imbricata]|uniref:Uncharacterized protein n=1 Tax=Pinctada imbricata TaxID=66713 RepID=A0AA88Y3H0_PINIB|nr:hypothetical protein FSP39_011664 [Pinctada imbricata]
MGNRCRLRTAICHGNSRRCGYPGLRAHNPSHFSDYQEVSKNVQFWCKTTSSLSDDHTQTRPQNTGAQATQMDIYFLLTIILAVTLAAHGPDNSICNVNQLPTNSGPKKPPLPGTYRVTIECNIEDKTYTTDYTEYYDQPNNRAAFHNWELGFHVANIYSYDTNELLTIEEQSGVCSVDKLSQANSNFLFGYTSSNTAKGVGKLYSAYGALRFGGNITEIYKGTTTVRGMLVNHWQSCMYWKNIDATMTVDWYFSAPGWTMATSNQIPVRCVVQGVTYEVKNGSVVPRNFNHTYEFSEFRNSIDPQEAIDIFETPSGVVCPHRLDTRPLPNPSNYFRFTSEILNPDMKSIGFIKEWYDYNMSLVRYDYKPQPENPSPYGFDLLSEIHDFSEGVAYIRDPAMGNCTPVPISAVGFDAKYAPDAIHVRIRNSKEFFYFDKTQYAYEGVKNVRGIDCNVWIGNRQDWPTGSPTNTTWEWYFAVTDWVQSTGHTYDFGMPIQMKLTANGIGSYIYNIYDYDEEQPSIFDFDITTCFNFSQKQDFAVRIKAKYKDTAGKNLQLFKYMVIMEVHKWTGISPLRVQNVNVDFDDVDVIIRFTILGGAPIAGDVTNPVQQVDLETAANQLTAAISKGSFQIPVDVTSLAKSKMYKASAYVINTKANNIVSNYYVAPPKKTSYTGGQMAGLGVGMLVLFFVIGFAAVFLYLRNKNGPIPSKSGNTSVDNPSYDKE